jgi:hypothetical protein
VSRALLLSLLLAGSAAADSTIDPGAAFAWGGNVGETNWRPSAAEGVVVGEYFCSGQIWSANTGWMTLGDGSPADGIRYGNADGADAGVNVFADEATGDLALRGLAWSANVGWVNFEAQGDPRIDPGTGELRGYAWSASCGWITLGVPARAVATESVAAAPDSDADGIGDAFELLHAGDLLAMDATTDLDADGATDAAEAAADTDPADPLAALRITHFSTPDSGATTDLAWTSRPTRRYTIETKLSLLDEWEPAVTGIAPDAGETTAVTLEATAAAQRFYRIRAKRPLAE